MKVANNLVVIVIIKQHTRLFYRHTFSLNMKVANNFVVIVDDDGPGIPVNQYKNVFKPFYRLDKGRNLNHSGVGLGLSIAEDIVRSHGGNIQLGDSKYKGLQVKISLPF